MTRFRRIVGIGFMTVLSTGVVSFVACGGGGGGTDESDLSSARVTQGTATPPGGNVVEQVIEVKDNLFEAQVVTIKSGTKVIWKWTGTTNPHSVQLGGSTSTEQTSGTYERVFSQGASTFNYQCGVHGASMTGKIVIE